MGGTLHRRVLCMQRRARALGQTCAQFVWHGWRMRLLLHSPDRLAGSSAGAAAAAAAAGQPPAAAAVAAAAAVVPAPAAAAAAAGHRSHHQGAQRRMLLASFVLQLCASCIIHDGM